MPDVTQYLWIIWLVFVVVCVIIELLTLEFTFLMIATGSLGGLAANLLGAPWWLQILVALVLSVLLILLIRPVLLRALRRGEDPTPSNVDALLGMGGRVARTVTDLGGLVKLANGETWTARVSPLTEHRDLLEGERVVVTAIDGSTAIVIPVERNTP
ncbi:membrane protein implicated in regulation of membrane protease activity [Diaminobutyricimonas aerilata]|uniref:Membrane protein implicated in regulation of membrane protease activity n=1 Tax=Diaminobutyricimonas aerilata TaxID=1162967 RepID=A0A2M9CJT9_9MICO|nr:NfeD family protein [Diaminobutyricimonas aerilata]PJJ72151.1 membrane protein implicated in regulation of membrane protease activity [Diaminobutyricimonas aerilata]